MRFISLFSGIEAASVAWLLLGWKCAAVAEIDKFPCAVLKHHYSGVPNLGNVCGITREMLIEIGPVDAVVFGFPCQDLSVAGKRAGLKGERSGLFFEAMRIVELCRELWGTRWTIAENVPGLFSSNSGLDFAAVVGELAGTEFAVPKNKWQNTGVALGPRGLVEWAVLDAQWFGVPQRRRRVFLVRDSGDWRSRPPILFERQSLRGNSPPSREKRESPTYDVAPCVGASGRGFDRPGDTRGQDCCVPVAFGGNNTSGPIDVATACNSHGGPNGRLDFESETFITGCLNANGKAAGSATQQDAETEMLVTHSLRADRFDASENGTGRGTPLISVQQNGTNLGFDLPSLRKGDGGFTSGVPAIGYMPARTFGKDGEVDSRYAPRDVCDAIHTGTGSGNKAPLILQRERVGTSCCPDCQIEFDVHYLPGTEIPEPFVCPECGDSPGFMTYDVRHGGTAPIAFNSREDMCCYGDQSGSLGSSSPQAQAVAFQEAQTGVREYPESGTLRANGPGHDPVGTRLRIGIAVRRLTPTECERLQKFPDGYTKINEKTADGPRYKALGNSMAVCCMEWIGRRIQLVDLFS